MDGSTTREIKKMENMLQSQNAAYLENRMIVNTSQVEAAKTEERHPASLKTEIKYSGHYYII